MLLTDGVVRKQFSFYDTIPSHSSPVSICVSTPAKLSDVAHSDDGDGGVSQILSRTEGKARINSSPIDIQSLSLVRGDFLALRDAFGGCTFRHKNNPGRPDGNGRGKIPLEYISSHEKMVSQRYSSDLAILK